jgi:branched-chain amino acid aminotransferase
MNVFFIIGDTAITPDLSSGTILAGVTRDSVLTVLQEIGLNVEERALSMDEVIEAHKAGQLKEVFGTGTAATISLIKELRYKDYVMAFDTDQWEHTHQVRQIMNEIRYGKRPDNHGWLMKL